MKSVQREISLIKKDTKEKVHRAYTYIEVETLAEARQTWGDDGVFKLALQADQTNHDNANRGALRREVEGGTSKIDRIKGLLASLSDSDKQALLANL